MSNSFVTNSGMIQFIPAGLGAELNVAGTAVALPALPDGARGALVSVKANTIRATFDGSAPVSAGAGHILVVGLYYFSREMCERARLIESAGSAAAVVRIEPGS